jgi:C4-dicarboxylate-specific signal transduction histidine kinase
LPDENRVARIEMLGVSISDFSEFPLEVTCKSVNVSQNINKFIYIWYLRDLRQQKAFEAIIEAQRTELITSSKLATLGEMAGGIAHEVNTPLTTIKFSIDLMKQNILEDLPDTDFMLQKIELVDKTLDRIHVIIKNLRNFARDGNLDPLKRESVHEIIDSSLSLCKEKFKKHNIQIEYCEKKNESHFISCRGVQISQVILNLLSNSFDAVESLENPWIKITMTEDIMNGKKFINIKVSDCGSGISPQIVDKMFNPFFTTKEVGKGTGMGLSISSGIIKTHGGELIYDHKSEYTCFIIKLPSLE